MTLLEGTEVTTRLVGNSIGAFLAIILLFVSIANFLAERSLIRAIEITIFALLTGVYGTWVINSVIPPLISFSRASNIIFYLWLGILIFFFLWAYLYSRQKMSKISKQESAIIYIVSAPERKSLMDFRFLKSFKVPGIFWAILIVLAVAFTHENAQLISDKLMISPLVIDFIIIGLISILKLLDLKDDDLERALIIIGKLLTDPEAANQIPPEERQEIPAYPHVRKEGQVHLQVPTLHTQITRFFLG